MLSRFEQLLDALPPLRRTTNANIACLVGLLTGGLGLAVYFRSVVDFAVPVAVAVAATLWLGDFGVLGGAVLAGIYGFARSTNSNERLAQAAVTKEA
jgi:hypothetical protein